MSAAALAARLRIEAATTATTTGGATDRADCHRCHSATTGDFLAEKPAATEGEMPHATAATGATAFLVEGQMQNAASGPDRAAGQGSIRVDSRFGTGANWRPLAADYYRHHFGCKTCISAGRGHGQRCTAGADLWAAYEAAAEADHHDTSRTTRRRQT